MAILLNNDGFWHDQWLTAIHKYLPGRDVHEYPRISDPAAIEYALVWKHPAGDLETYPNLKAVFSLGSGVDYIDAYSTLPKAPIFRLIDPAMAEDMALYTLYWTIHFQRLFKVYRSQQKESHWHRYPTPLAPDFHIGLLGMGAIGSHIAKVLAKNGFEVSGWSRSPKSFEGVNCVHGEEGLSAILPELDVLVCCLPLNTATRWFINADLLGQLKKGAGLINVSRGAVIDEAALLAELDKGRLAGAALDVFETEPLPKSSRFWNHPLVNVTPHMSGATNPDTAVQIIARDIARFERGGMPEFIYQREVTAA